MVHGEHLELGGDDPSAEVSVRWVIPGVTRLEELTKRWTTGMSASTISAIAAPSSASKRATLLRGLR